MATDLKDFAKVTQKYDCWNLITDIHASIGYPHVKTGSLDFPVTTGGPLLSNEQTHEATKLNFVRQHVDFL